MCCMVALSHRRILDENVVTRGHEPISVNVCVFFGVYVRVTARPDIG